jgi:multidrug efflux pump subunit AcrA (membrane-fusion protein)
VGEASAGRAQVFVVADGHVKLRQVRVGKDSGLSVEVLSGLSEADEVVVRPPGGLVDGAEVTTGNGDAEAGAQISHVGR